MPGMAKPAAPKKRTLGDIRRSVLTPKSYKAALSIFRYFTHPLDVISRYAFGSGSYPCVITVRTPLGLRSVTMNSFHDVRSLIVCFAKEDYGVELDIRCAVDFGANIGMSGLYFLTRNARVQVYLFEPLPQNVTRLRENLRGLERRYTLEQSAVGLANGTAQFVYEPTGRYGGIRDALDTHEEIDRPYTLEVATLSAVDRLRRIIEKEGFIDILKVNIEGLETDVLKSLTPDILDYIGLICAEIFYFPGEIEGFRKQKYGSNITRFTNLHIHDRNAARTRADSDSHEGRNDKASENPDLRICVPSR
jgi:FkbM family methyltransferase